MKINHAECGHYVRTGLVVTDVSTWSENCAPRSTPKRELIRLNWRPTVCETFYTMLEGGIVVTDSTLCRRFAVMLSLALVLVVLKDTISVLCPALGLEGSVLAKYSEVLGFHAVRSTFSANVSRTCHRNSITQACRSLLSSRNERCRFLKPTWVSPKRHIDRFSRFGRAHERDQQTYKQTTL